MREAMAWKGQGAAGAKGIGSGIVSGDKKGKIPRRPDPKKQGVSSERGKMRKNDAGRKERGGWKSQEDCCWCGRSREGVRMLQVSGGEEGIQERL